MKNIRFLLLVPGLLSLFLNAQTPISLLPQTQSQSGSSNHDKVVVSADGLRVVVNKNKEVVAVWDIQTKVQVGMLPFVLPVQLPDTLKPWVIQHRHAQAECIDVAFLPNSDVLVVWYEWILYFGGQKKRHEDGKKYQSLIVWNWRENKIIAQIPLDFSVDNTHSMLAVAPDGSKVALGTRDGNYYSQVVVADLNSKRCVFNKKIDKNNGNKEECHLLSVHFGINANEVLLPWQCGAKNSHALNAIERWDIQSGQKTATLTPHSDWKHLHLLCLNPDSSGQYLMAAYRKSDFDTLQAAAIVRWDLRTNKNAPLPNIKADYHAINGEFKIAASTYDFGYNAFFYENNRYLCLYRRGVFDIYAGRPFPAVGENIANFLEEPIAPIPGKAFSFINNDLQIGDIGTQVQDAFFLMDLPLGILEEQIVFGEAGLLFVLNVPSYGDKYYEVTPWSLQNLNGESNLPLNRDKHLTGDYGFDKLSKIIDTSYYSVATTSGAVLLTKKEGYCYGNKGKWAAKLEYGCLSVYENGPVKKLLYSFGKSVQAFSFSPDGGQILVACYNTVEAYRLPDFKLVQVVDNKDPIKSLDLNPEGNRLAVLNTDGFRVAIWDWPKASLIATLQLLKTDVWGKEGGFYLYTPDGYYAVSKGEEPSLGFKVGDQYLSYEQLDLYFNRPDIVLKRLGFADPAYMARLEQACQKRTEKFGLSRPETMSDLQIPEVRLNNGVPLPFGTKEKKIQIKVEASDSKYNLSNIQVYVNEVPILGTQGKAVNPSLRYSGTIDIALVQKTNVVEVQATNVQGVKSFKKRFTIVYEGELPKPDLYVVAIGVSKYKDAKMNLQYAAKDAKDVVNVFKNRFGAFRNIHSFEFLDETATKEKILDIKSTLAQSRPEDRVVVFAAGHGVLDEKLDFYYATHDVDFLKPAANGISFELLESLVGDIPARQKLLLLDACFSGELDPTTVRSENATPNSGSQSINFRASGRRVAALDAAADPFDLMKDLFVDLRRSSGAIIISAAGGKQMAMEDAAIHNGVFTHVLLEALTNKISKVSELQRKIFERVSELTKGAQVPTSRVDYLFNDFEIWKIPKEERALLWPGGGNKVSPQKIKDAILDGANINQRYSDNIDGATLLMLVTHEYDDEALVRWLIEKGADPTLKGSLEIKDGEKNMGYYGNLTSIAAAQGKVNLLKYFIETCKIPVDDKEYNPETKSENGWTALQWAANNGQIKAAAFLLDKGAKPNERSGDDTETPLMLAAAKGHLDVAKLLMARGGDWKLKKKEHTTALQMAIHAGQLEYAKWLVSLCAPAEKILADSKTLLMEATLAFEDTILLQSMIKKGANPQNKGTLQIYNAYGQKTDGYYGNLLGIAAAQGKLDLLQFFMERCKIPVDDKELDPATQTETGWTALQWAANNGQTKAVQYLLDKQAKVDGRLNEASETALLLAVSGGHLETAKLLVARGANWRIRGSDGNTLLHYAATSNSLACLRWAVSIGADHSSKNSKGKRPLDLVDSEACYACYSYLRQLK